MRKGHWAVVTALALMPWVSAWAQQFPVDGAYRPWPCFDGGVIVPMFDDRQDEPGAFLERDLVGDAGAPAGLRAADPNFLYVRFRVDEDPAPGGTPLPFAWGLLLDTDGDASTYEVMLLADGGAGAVSIYQNTSVTPGNLRDPPDPTPVTPSSAWDLRARSELAPGSSSGGNPDYFVDVAFSWTDLDAVGVRPTSVVRVWAATSSSANTPSTGMTGDFACRSGGAPGPADAWPRTVSDPGPDSDGDGFSDASEVESGTNPNDPNSRPTSGGEPKLAGGGGCHSGPAGIPAVGILLALALRARRRHSEQ
jgi:hypothetical protein